MSSIMPIPTDGSPNNSDTEEPIEDVEAEYIEAEDVEAEDIEAEDIEAEDVEAEDVEAEDIEAEGDDGLTKQENLVVGEKVSIAPASAIMNILGEDVVIKPIEIDEDITGESNKKLNNNDNIHKYHPESAARNYDEIHKASFVTRNDENIIVDQLHKTIPVMTKYEKAKVLGQRTKQLDHGAQAFVTFEKKILDNSIIAEEELYQKKIPFIIQRPLPGGGVEYWHVKDLEVIRDD